MKSRDRELAREAERRRRQREPFGGFLERWLGALVAEHQCEAVEVLEEAHHAGGGRIVIAMPPGYGKSTIAIGYDVWRQQITGGTQRQARASYAGKLSRQLNRTAREAAVDVGGVMLDPTATSDALWRTTSGGFSLATSIGRAAATGFRLDSLTVDDHLAGRAEAESALVRERSIDWHRSVGRTRLEPGASVLIVATRWHPSDLSAWAIEHGYRYVHVPALNDADEST